MPYKGPENFLDENGEFDGQAAADYLESAEAADDANYDILVDVPSGQIYQRIDGSWVNGHTHRDTCSQDENGDDWERGPNDEQSQNREWTNNWLIEDNVVYVPKTLKKKKKRK